MTMRRPKKKKLSKRKQQELREAAEVQAAREIARQRAMTLPEAEGAPPAAPAAERLQVLLRPLASTRRHLRFEVKLSGSVSLGEDEPPTPVDLAFVENVAWGESLEIGIRELLEGTESEDDMIIAITPQP